MWWLHRKVAVCALLIAYAVLFMSSVSVLTEARISKFEAIQESLVLQRRQLRPIEYSQNTPLPNPPLHHDR
ncbi:hypothetical protein POPTR_006G106150v4 [Populus trichocarpa]|uniref:Uncharacterized protein n=1 Tax=Populus trichocarpa TaxID=3694 RepID=A0A3N7F2A3_POPTR|nr:hypothetical protein POPTR_006G106150v4 [Populus trichocarpa]